MTSQEQTPGPLRRAISVPLPAIADAARYLDAAVTAHLRGNRALAEALIRIADLPEVRQWTKSIWADNNIHLRYPNADPFLPKGTNQHVPMVSAGVKAKIHERDGHHCRFCGIPVIRPEVRRRIRTIYPDALIWGNREIEQHAAFQAMWAQYDHLLPRARGGTNALNNLILTCAPCNFGRGGYTLAEVGVDNPWLRPPVESAWDGLERFR